MVRAKVGAVALAVACAAVPEIGKAQTSRVEILPGIPAVSFTFGDQALVIRRAQDPDATLPADFAKTARACPPHCIEPANAAPGVSNVTELEVLDFMSQKVAGGQGLLVDTRLPEQHASGSIPGAISMPAATLVANNPYREDLLLALGAKGAMGAMDFSGAYDLLVFDEGPWSPTARQAVERLIEAGYPAGKVFYYRGGLQLWHVFGLTVSK